jgi:hypothetical protein
LGSHELLPPNTRGLSYPLNALAARRLFNSTTENRFGPAYYRSVALLYPLFRGIQEWFATKVNKFVKKQDFLESRRVSGDERSLLPYCPVILPFSYLLPVLRLSDYLAPVLSDN